MSIAESFWSLLRLIVLLAFAAAAAALASDANAAAVMLGATAGDNRIDLSWSTSGTLRDIQVMCDTDADPSGQQRVAILGGNVRSYTDSTVEIGRQYRHWIKYTDTAGASGNSNAVSATPVMAPRSR